MLNDMAGGFTGSHSITRIASRAQHWLDCLPT